MELSNDFSRGDGDWMSEEGTTLTPVRFDGFAKLVGIQSQGSSVYFKAPAKYLGDQRTVYNHQIRETE